jgi:hypothetical protein
MRGQFLTTLALTGLSSAHFILHYPPTGVDFDEETEGTSPCGGIDVQVSDDATQLQVGRFAVSIESTHPAGHWSFRGSIDTEPPFNFTDLTAMVSTTGAGEFCLDFLSAPAEFAGNPGVIQIEDVAIDGSLYQV